MRHPGGAGGDRIGPEGGACLSKVTAGAPAIAWSTLDLTIHLYSSN